MCGRFALHTPGPVLAKQFRLEGLPALLPRFNVAPTQPVVAIRAKPGAGEREGVLLQWGLIPSWAQDPTIGSRMINARAETVAEKPAFRAAFKYRRCLIPADGFYEWKKLDGRRQSYYIALHDGSPFAFAGLWEHWEGADGSVVDSCTILTTEPNELIEDLHNRMPVILPPEDYDRWLDPNVRSPELLQPLLRPYPAEEMIAYPVSTLVNNPTNDAEELIRPLAI